MTNFPLKKRTFSYPRLFNPKLEIVIYNIHLLRIDRRTNGRETDDNGVDAYSIAVIKQHDKNCVQYGPNN